MMTTAPTTSASPMAMTGMAATAQTRRSIARRVAVGHAPGRRSCGRLRRVRALGVHRWPSGGRPRSCRPSSVERGDDPPAVHDGDAVGELEHLVELCRDEQDGRPASRFAIACRWMNSMLPTSRPRVGWSRTSSLRSRPNSRATTTFCWLPPESVRGRDGRRRRADVVTRRCAPRRRPRMAARRAAMPRAKGAR